MKEPSKCLTVQMLIDELSKIPNKKLYVLDSGYDFIEKVRETDIGGEKYIQFMARVRK